MKYTNINNKYTVFMRSLYICHIIDPFVFRLKEEVVITCKCQTFLCKQ